ncbi:hypothetical protein D3C78_1825780 [compost metagenome]
MHLASNDQQLIVSHRLGHANGVDDPLFGDHGIGIAGDDDIIQTQGHRLFDVVCRYPKTGRILNVLRHRLQIAANKTAGYLL